MSVYLLDLYYDGAHIWEGTYTVYGYQFSYNSGADANYLPGAKKALKAWRRRQPSQMRKPVPEEVIFALSTQLLNMGHIDTAVALGIQYHTYMRPSEVITLQHLQLCPPVRRAMHSYPRWAVVLAPDELGVTTKTGENNESVLIDNQYHSWLSPVLSSIYKRGSKSRVFPQLTLHKYEEHFKQATQALQLPLDLTPHIVRHSGPSNDFYHRRKTLKQIQRHGRWAAEKSVKRYQKSALLMQAWSLMEESVQNKIIQAARSFPPKI